MNALKLLAVVSILSVPAVAQPTSGFFFNAGGGLTKLSAEDFSFTTSYGEVLRSTDTDDSSSLARINLGWQFTPRWALTLGYADLGSAEATLQAPRYTGLVSILPFPDYSRNVLKLEASRLSLLPVYTHALTEKLRVSASAGLTRTESESHFESTYRLYFSGPPSREESRTFSTAKKSSWSYLASIGLDYAFTEHLSIGVTATYAPFEMTPPPYEVAQLGGGRFTKQKIKVDSLEAAVSFTWRL